MREPCFQCPVLLCIMLFEQQYQTFHKEKHEDSEQQVLPPTSHAMLSSMRGKSQRLCWSPALSFVAWGALCRDLNMK